MTRWTRHVLWLLVLAAAVFAAAFLIPRTPGPTTVRPSDTVTGSNIGGSFTLVDQTGATVTDQTYQDRFKLIFFGFTYCPSICPMELKKITDALEQIGPLADKLYPIFVSIDPERDTPEVMKEYVAQFSPRVVGLTGTPAQVKDMVDAYNVYAAKVPQDGGDYTMDHSAFIYLMSPEGQLLTLYRSQQTAEEIAADLQARLQ